MMPQLSEVFEVRLREGSWKGWNPLSRDNVQGVLDCCPIDDREWYILGNSFGNRVLCAMYSVGSFVAQPNGIILCGYPMWAKKGTEERVLTLQSLPPHCNVLCISGEKDTFLRSTTHQSTKLTARAAYESIIETLPCRHNTVLCMVDKGGHGVIDVPKKELESVISSVIQWITKFVQNKCKAMKSNHQSAGDNQSSTHES
jgi:hypothetical protein